jgi:hypothetical protein
MKKEKVEKCKTKEQPLNLERSGGGEKAPGTRIQGVAK